MDGQSRYVCSVRGNTLITQLDIDIEPKAVNLTDFATTTLAAGEGASNASALVGRGGDSPSSTVAAAKVTHEADKGQQTAGEHEQPRYYMVKKQTLLDGRQEIIAHIINTFNERYAAFYTIHEV